MVIQSENHINESTNITMATSVLSRKKGVIVGDDVLKVCRWRECSANAYAWKFLDATREQIC